MRFSVVLLVLMLPGCAAARGLLPTRSRFERWTVGGALALATAAGVCWYSAAIGRLHLAVYVWAAVSLLAIGWRITLTSGLIGVVRPRPDSPMPWAILALSAVIWVEMMGRLPFPVGWDPSFHAILAESIRRSGGLVADWRPFEQIGVNYPLGPHALMAAIATATDLRVPAVFGWLLMSCGVLLCGLTYTMARAVGQGRWAATVAMVLMAVWAWRGSTEYGGWGGLPNLMGVCVLMGAAVLVLRGRKQTGVVFGGGIVGVLPAIHHHVALSAAIVLFALVPTFRRYPRAFRTFLITAMVAGAGPVLWLLTRVGRLGQTGVASDAEVFLWPWELSVVMGVGFCIAAIFGVWTMRHHFMRTTAMGNLYRAIAALSLAFVSGDYGYRVWRWAAHLPPATLFTPSRFLTDAVPGLAILGGAAMVPWLGKRFRGHRTLWMMALVGGGILVSLPNWVDLWLRQMPDVDDVRAWRWIEANTPTDSVLCTRNIWAGAVSWRRTLRTPIPISEPIGLLDYSPEGLRKRAQGHTTYEVKDPTALAAGERVKYLVPGGRRAVVETPGIPRHFFVIDDLK